MSTLEDQIRKQLEEQEQPEQQDLETQVKNQLEEKQNFETGRANLALSMANKRQPEETSKIINFANKHNVPVGFVERNKDRFFEEEKNHEIREKIKEAAPITVSYFQDEHKAAVSKNEIGQLSDLEKQIKNVLSNKTKKVEARNYGEDLANAFSSSYYMVKAGLLAEHDMSGITDAGAMAADIARAVRMQRQKDAMEPEYVKGAMRRYEKEREELGESFDQLTTNFKDKTFSKIIDEGTETVGELFDLVSNVWKDRAGLMYTSTKSLATFLPHAVGGAIGTGVGAMLPIGDAGKKILGTVGGIAAGTKTEAGLDLLGELEQRGIDTGNERELYKALTNKSLMESLKWPAYRKGFGTASVDVLTTIAGAKLMGSAFKSGTLMSRLGKLAAGQALEVGGEGLSEFSGQALKYKGDLSKIDPNEVLDEMYFSILNPIAVLGGGVSVVTEFKKTITGEAAAEQAKAKKTKETKEEVIIEGQPVELTPEQERAKYSPEPNKAMGEIAIDIDKSNQAMEDARTLINVADKLKEIKDTKKIKGAISEFVDKMSEGDDTSGNVYFDSEEYDNFFKSTGIDIDTIFDKLSDETKESYKESKINGTRFDMPLGEFVEHILTDDKMKSLINFVKVREDGMSLGEASEFRAKAPEVINKVAKEGDEKSKKKKFEKSNKAKIAESIKEKIKSIGFSEDQAKYVSQIYTSLIDTSSKVLGEKTEDFYKKFSLNFHRQSAKRQSKKKILLQAKSKERAKIAKHLERMPENVAQKVIAEGNVTEKRVKELIDEDVKLNNKAQKALSQNKETMKDRAKKISKKLSLTTEFDHSTLPDAVREIADEILEASIKDYLLEVESADKPTSVLVDRYEGEVLVGKERVYTESTYPSDYKDLKVGKAENLPKAIEKFEKTGKKNALYKRLERVVQNRLINGYESKQTGPVMPDNTYRSTIGLNPLDEKGYEVETDFTLFDDVNSPRGQARILGKNFDVSIFKDGNINTLMHETGHVWLEMVRLTMEELSAKTEINEDQQNYINEAKAMLEYLGVESFDQITDEHHELFAKTVHAYLGSGKAPNQSLRDAFIRFKAWVVNFFKDVDNIGIEMNPEIERFMGALLASEIEAEEASVEYGSMDSFQQAIALGMTEKEARRYQHAIMVSKLSAEEQITSEIAYKKRKEQLSEHRKHRKAVKEEVIAELENDPRYKAVSEIRNTDSKLKMDKSQLLKLLKPNRKPPTVKFKKEMAGEYISTDNKYKIEKNPESKEWHLYYMIDGVWEWSVGSETKKDLVVRVEEEVAQEAKDFEKEVAAEEKKILKSFKGMYVNEGGADINVIAEWFGFKDAKDLLANIKDFPSKNELIEQETDLRLEMMFPDILSDDRELDAIAEEAFLNVDRAKVLGIEIEHLMRVYPEQVKKLITKTAMKSSKEFKADAKREIGNTAISKINTHRYAEAVRKHAKAAATSIAKGDIAKVVEHKQKELLNLEMYRESKEAVKYENRVTKKFKKLAKVDPKKKDIDYVNGARALLEKHKAGVYNAEALNKELTVLKKRNPEKYDKIDSIIKSINLPPISIKELTYNQFYEVSESVLAMEEIARLEKSVEIEGKMVEKETIIEELQAGISEHLTPEKLKKYREEKGRSATQWDEFKRGVLSMAASLVRVEHWADRMDFGDKINGPFSKYIFRPVAKAADKFRVEKTKTLKKYKAIVEKYQEERGEMPEGSIEAKELGFTFSSHQHLIGALMHIGNPSNLAKLLVGYGWGEMVNGELDRSRFDAFLKRAISEGIITEADVDFAQNVGYLMAELKPAAQEAHKRIEGKYFNEITAEPFEMFGKTYEGWYAPAIIDSAKVEDQLIREEMEAFEAKQNSFMWPSTGNSFTHERTGVTLPLKLDANVFGSHMDKVLRYTHLQPTIKQVASIVHDQKFRDSLSTIDRAAGTSLLNPWLQRAAAQRVETPAVTREGRAVSNIFRAMRTNSGMMTMFLNVANTMEQFTGLSITMIKVAPKYMRHGLSNYLFNREDTLAMVHDKSDFMKERQGSQMIAINTRISEILLNPSKIKKGKNWIREHGYFMQEATQNIVDTISWVGAYEQATMEGKTDAQAIIIADATVRETQGSFNPEDISAIEAGNAFVRMFTMFYSYFNMQANVVGSEFAKTIEKQGLKKGAGRLLYVYMMGIMIPNFVSRLIRAALSGKIDEDDDGEYLDDIIGMFFGSQIRGLASLTPLRAPIEGFLNQFDDIPWNDDMTFSPSMSALGSSVRVGKHIANALNEDKEVNTNAAVRDVLTSISLMSGFPVLPAYKPYKYGKAMAEGEVETDNPLEVIRGLTTGKTGE